MKKSKKLLILSIIFGAFLFLSNVKAMTYAELPNSDVEMLITDYGCVSYEFNNYDPYISLNGDRYFLNEGNSSALENFNFLKNMGAFPEMEYSLILSNFVNATYNDKKWYSLYIIFNGKFNLALLGTANDVIPSPSKQPVYINRAYMYPINDNSYYAFQILLSAEEGSTESYIASSYISDTYSYLYNYGSITSDRYFKPGTYSVVKYSAEENQPYFAYNKTSTSTPGWKKLLNDYTSFYSKYGLPYCSKESNFTLEKKEYTNMDGEITGEKLTATFEKVDTTKYKYEFIDVNATDNKTEFTPREDKTFEWFYIKNNAFCVYVSERETGEQVASNCEIESSFDETKEFMSFSYDESKNEYIEVDGEKILYSKYLEVKLNIDDLSINEFLNREYLKIEYYSEDKEFHGTLENVTNTVNLTKNQKVTFYVTGLNTGIQYEKTIDFSDELDEINSLNEMITWKEECRENNKYCTVSTRFINYNTKIHQYYVRKGENDWIRVYPDTFSNYDLYYYSFEESDEIDTYCAMVKDKNEIILQSCYTNQKFSSQANFKTFITRIKKFINDQNSTIKHISAMVEKSYLLIDVKIRTFIEFIYFLACLYAVVWNVRR